MIIVNLERFIPKQCEFIYKLSLFEIYLLCLLLLIYNEKNIIYKY
jgi:hypothetical protein